MAVVVEMVVSIENNNSIVKSSVKTLDRRVSDSERRIGEVQRSFEARMTAVEQGASSFRDCGSIKPLCTRKLWW